MDECPQCSKDTAECQCSTRLMPSQKETVEATADDELKTASRIQGYKQIQLLGRGASSAVFLAEQLSLSKRVAIKRLYQTLNTDTRAISRFEQEARALSNLKHPNLAEVFDLGTADDGTLYIVMEYADGPNLKSLIAKGVLEPTRVVQIARQLCDALAYAHDNEIVHRDLKPENIILVNDWQGNEQVKLVDFGIAKPTAQGGEIQRLTQTGELVGSPSYMSPEQIRGDQIDQRTDIYSLGCIMYEALTGRVPFRGESMMSTLALHLEQTPEPITQVNANLSAWKPLCEVVTQCLEKDKNRRIASAQSLKSALDNLTAPQPKGQTDTFRLLALVFGVVLTIISTAIFLSDQKNLLKSTPDGKAALEVAPVSGTAPSNKKIAANITPADLRNATSDQNKIQQELAMKLARAEVLYYSGFEAKSLAVYSQSLDDAFRANASAETKLAISTFLIDTLHEFNYKPQQKDALYKRLRPSINSVLKSTSNELESLFGAYFLYKYASSKCSEAQELYKDYSTREQSKERLNEGIALFHEALTLAKRRQDIDSSGLLGRIYEALGTAYSGDYNFNLARQSFKQSFDWLKSSEGLTDEETREVALQLSKATIALYRVQRKQQKHSTSAIPVYLKTTREALESIIDAHKTSKVQDNSDGLEELQNALKELNAQLPS